MILYKLVRESPAISLEYAGGLLYNDHQLVRYLHKLEI